AETWARSGRRALDGWQGAADGGGPRGLTPLDLTSLRPFGLAEGLVAGFPVVVCRTGYTGEDGFELLVEAAAARELWDALLAAAMRRGGLACGLGARATLRLAGGLARHG